MAHTSNVLLLPLYQKIDEAFSRDKAAQLRMLAKKYFASSANADLASRTEEQLFESLLVIWDFIEVRPGSAPKIEFLNDAREGERTGTHIYLLLNDMPFVIDSVRQCLNRLGATVAGLNNCVLYVQRDKGKKSRSPSSRGKSRGQILAMADAKEAGYRAEALSCVHCAPISEEQQQLIRRELIESLRHVTAAVKAYRPMCAKALEIRDKLLASAEQLPVSREELSESVEFIDWIVNNHFTFLGYEEYRIRNRAKGKVLEFQEDSVLGVSRFKESLRKEVKLAAMPEGTAEVILANQICSFAKSSQRSRVHRPAYYDYLLVREFDAEGAIVTEHRFKGLYTSSVYYRPALDIPLVRKKVQKILDRSGFAPNGHSIKDLLQIINVFPRDELFQMSTEQLFDTAIQITQFQETRTCKLFVRKDSYGRFFSCLVFVPRDIYTTRVRLKIQDFLSERLRATELEFNTYLSESILARLHLVLRVPEIHQVKYDLMELEASLVELVKPWEEHFREALQQRYEHDLAARRFQEFANCFPVAYQEAYPAQEAVVDAQRLLEAREHKRLVLSLQPRRPEAGAELSFKLFSRAQQLMLSDIDPVLENLGLYIISERTFKLQPGHCDVDSEADQESDPIWLHDFSLFRKNKQGVVDPQVARNFEAAFAAIWKGDVDDDSFNALVMTADLEWRDVALLRSYAAYLKQLQFGYTSQFIAETLATHAQLSRALRDYFYLLFDPALSKKQRQRAGHLRKTIVAGIDEVSNLAEDSVLRAYLDLIDATLRSNFFQHDAAGRLKTYFSFKFAPGSLEFVPRPKPKFEIFVYSRGMEGVHLRGGKVARGGLRWSDRSEDYRTEVLGLVKAQQVKNSVIVPVGAKGGFIVKEQPVTNSRDAVQALAVASYKTFICGLLDLTDNMREGELLPPDETIRRDDDDPYLVVAADKGTASFSDIANGIAADYGFWLGDGFASGGSHGYDHKAMGITARGAWVSVQRHFRELGIDVQNEDFTVVGIGDMSGDVFGNGMLLSKHIRLLAAFNHRHIFVDPNPDPQTSFRERRRLFNKKGSAWSDYNAELISAGGGVFERSAKSIVITPQMKSCFGIDRDKLTPNQLISALLRSPVDLIWNGGIGTYVKASSESHSDVGDKSNDALRVNGDELHCRVIGEGGNLGLTQQARIEYGKSGGVSLTDFIDNSAGVDCSDHEVNIKILLNQLQHDGKLTEARRYRLLESMTDEVAGLVLENNYQQVQAIGIAHSEAESRHQEYSDLIRYLEQHAGLDRQLEFLPADDELEERAGRGQYLTRPELSVLISYMKLHLKAELVSVDYIDDHYLTSFLYSAFPDRLRKKYPTEILGHPLRKEIIASQLANRLVNLFGASFIYRMIDSTGAFIGDVVKAMLLSMEIYQIEETWHAIEKLDYQVPSTIQNRMMCRLIRLVRRSARWLLRNRRSELNIEKEIEYFSGGVKRYRKMLPAKLPADYRELFQRRFEELQQAGVNDSLAKAVCQCDFLFPASSFIEISSGTGESLASTVAIYYTLGEELRLNWLGKMINELPVTNYWQALARETYLDDLAWQQRALTCNLVAHKDRSGSPGKQVDHWIEQHATQITRLEQMLSQLQTESGSDYAVYSVVLRELLNLAQNTAYRG